MNSKELVERYFDSVEGRSAAPITDYLAADIRWHLPPAHPFGSDFSGIDGVLGMMAKGAGWLDFATLQIRRHALICEGDNVAVHFELTAQTCSGEPYLNQYLLRFRCCDAKICEVWEFLDTYSQYRAGLYQQVI